MVIDVIFVMTQFDLPRNKSLRRLPCGTASFSFSHTASPTLNQLSFVSFTVVALQPDSVLNIS